LCKSPSPDSLEVVVGAGIMASGAEASESSPLPVEALPVGPHALSADAVVLSLSLSIKDAAALHSLAPELDGSGVKFWFSYSLFDVVVQTDQFEQLSDAAPTAAAGSAKLFAAVCDTFKLRATLADLREHLAQHTPLHVYLCTEQRVIASAEIPLSSVLPDSSTAAAAAFTEATLEQAFVLQRAEAASPSRSSSSTATPSPTVTLSVTLTRVLEPAAAAPTASSSAADGAGAADSAPAAAAAASVLMPGAVTARLGALQLPAALRRGGLRVAIGDSAAPAEQFDLVKWQWTAAAAPSSAVAAAAVAVRDPMTRVTVTSAVTGEVVARGDVPWPRGAGGEEAVEVALLDDSNVKLDGW
jgi:Cep120 protein